MSDTTIRDILIKVAIEQGNLSLDLDTSGAMKKVEELRAAVGSIKQGSSGGSAGSPLSGDLGDIFGIDLDTSGSGTSGEGWDALLSRQNPKRGSGGGSSSKPPKNEWLEAAKQAQKERDADHSKYLKQLEEEEKAANKRYDEEAAAAIRSYSKIMSERKKAAEEEKRARQDQIEGTRQVTQGLLYMAAASQENSEQMIRGIVQIQGAYKVLQGGAAAAGPVGVAVTGLISAILAYDTIIEHSKTLTKSYWSEMAADAARAADVVSQSAVRIGSQGQQRVSNRIDTSGTNSIATLSRMQRNEESQIRDVEARADLSDQMKGQYRREKTREQQRAETGPLLERETFLKSGISSLDKSQGDIAERAAEAKKAHQSAIDQQKAAEKHARETAGFTFFERSKESLTYRAISGDTGPANQGSQDTAAEQARLATMEAVKNAQKEMASIESESLSITQQKAGMERELIETQKQRLTVTKEIKQAAYEDMRNTREAARKDAINFGSQDFGEQNKGIRLQKKHEAIEAQKAANKAAGKDEWEGVAQFTQDELRFSLSSGGIEAKSARAQAERQAKASGRKFESNQAADYAKAEHDGLDTPLEKEIQKTESSIESGSISLKATAQSVGKITEAVQKWDTDIKELENKIKELEQAFKSRQQLRW